MYARLCVMGCRPMYRWMQFVVKKGGVGSKSRKEKENKKGRMRIGRAIYRRTHLRM